MASTSTARRLSEILKEKQEPFVLETYLLERGCSRRRSLELEARFGCCSTSTTTTANNKLDLKRVLKRSWSYHGSSSTSSGQFSSIAKSVYSKIVSINHVFGLKSSNKGKNKTTKNQGDDDDDQKDVAEESGRFSSASCSTTLCNSSSGSDIETSLAMDERAHEGGPDRVMTQWRFTEDNKQCSPVSVLDEIDFLQEIPVYNNVRQEQEETPSTSRTRFHKKLSDDTILSATLLDLLMQSRRPNPTERETFPLQMNSKKGLQQTRQLLFDCIKEVVEMSHKGKQQISRMRRKQKGLVIGPEEIGNIVRNNFKAWGKLKKCNDERNIAQLLRAELVGSAEEWSSLEGFRRDVAGDIGDAILQHLMEDIVEDMIHSY